MTQPNTPTDVGQETNSRGDLIATADAQAEGLTVTRSPIAVGSNNGGSQAASEPAAPPAPSHPPKPGRRRTWVIGAVLAVVAVIAATRWAIRAFNTVSTDDAYVNGHVTFVAPRVGGQVAAVLVDDNNRVRKGDPLLRLDREPYDVQVGIAETAVAAAEADLVAAHAQARALVSQTRAARFNLEHAIQEVDDQIALLHSKAATLAAQEPTLDKTKFEYDRTTKIVRPAPCRGRTQRPIRSRSWWAQAKVEEALQGVYQVRVSLGLSPTPESGDDLTHVPPDLDQTFSSVKQAQMALVQVAAQLGASDSLDKSPRQMVADFYNRDPDRNIDRIYTELEKNAPAAKQAEARLAQARRSLDQAKLNLRYCDVVAGIDGVVTRRNVNPENNVLAGQSVMAVRSVSEVWVDANFKETQLAGLRIGQAVDLDVDMYGRRRHFQGRISGFTYGTGSTLALLPAENATGNFVKVVQRLPVRVELSDYDPEREPLFVGLSVTTSVDLRRKPSGPGAGLLLQPQTAPAADRK